MNHIIDKSQWTPADLRVLRERSQAAGLTEDEFIERTAKHALYNLPVAKPRKRPRKRKAIPA